MLHRKITIFIYLPVIWATYWNRAGFMNDSYFTDKKNTIIKCISQNRCGKFLQLIFILSFHLRKKFSLRLQSQSIHRDLLINLRRKVQKLTSNRCPYVKKNRSVVFVAANDSPVRDGLGITGALARCERSYVSPSTSPLPHTGGTPALSVDACTTQPPTYTRHWNCEYSIHISMTTRTAVRRAAHCACTLHSYPLNEHHTTREWERESSGSQRRAPRQASVRRICDYTHTAVCERERESEGERSSASPLHYTDASDGERRRCVAGEKERKRLW